MLQSHLGTDWPAKNLPRNPSIHYTPVNTVHVKIVTEKEKKELISENIWSGVIGQMNEVLFWYKGKIRERQPVIHSEYRE